jgi:hypothetical protein
MKTRTIILAKDAMVGLFALADNGKRQCLTTVDPRREIPSVRVYEDSHAANAEMRRELSITIERGWQIIYDGLPNFG